MYLRTSGNDFFKVFGNKLVEYISRVNLEDYNSYQIKDEHVQMLKQFLSSPGIQIQKIHTYYIASPPEGEKGDKMSFSKRIFDYVEDYDIYEETKEKANEIKCINNSDYKYWSKVVHGESE